MAQTRLAQQHRQLATPINRMLQVHLVQPPHQRQVLLRLRASTGNNNCPGTLPAARTGAGR